MGELPPRRKFRRYKTKSRWTFVFYFLLTILCFPPSHQQEEPPKAKPKLRQGFEAIGTLAAGLSYAHVVTVLNFTSIRVSIDVALDHIEESVNKTVNTLIGAGSNDSARAHQSWWFAEREHALRHRTTLDHLELLLEPVHTRPKRQALAAAALLASAAGFGFELFNQQKIAAITRRVGDLEDNFVHFVDTETAALKTLDDNQREIETTVNQILYTLNNFRRFILVQRIETRMKRLLQEIKDKVELTANTVYHLLQGKIYPPLFNAKTLHASLKNVAAKLSLVKHTFLHDVLRDFYRFEVTYSHEAEGDVKIIVHIPISETDGGPLNLYRMMPTPFINDKGVLYTLVPKKPILAVNSAQTRSIDLSPGELAGCRKIGTLHYCDSIRITYQDIEASCVGAAYSGHIEGMKHLCDVKIERSGEAVLPLNHTSFLILSKKGSVRIQDTCSKVGKDYPSGWPIQLKPGCTAFTHHHWFYATGDMISPTQIVHTPMEISENLINLQEYSLSDVKRQVLNLRHPINTRDMLLEDVKRRIREGRAESTQTSLHVIFTFLAAFGIITVFALAAHIYYTGYKSLRSRKKNSNLTKFDQLAMTHRDHAGSVFHSSSHELAYPEADQLTDDRSMSD